MKITKEQFDALTAAQKKLWKAAGDEYEMVDGDTEIAAEMRRARDREKKRGDDAENRVTELEARLTEIEGNNGRKNNDIAAIEKSWSDKLGAEKTKAEKQIAALKQHLEKTLIEGTIGSIAADIFTNPKRDGRLLSDRVKVEYDGDTPVVRILDKDGKPSALTVEDLKKETVDNKDYSDILIGSKASGSGGTGGNKGGGAAKQPKDYTEAERVQLYRTDRAKFQELFPSPAV